MGYWAVVDLDTNTDIAYSPFKDVAIKVVTGLCGTYPSGKFQVEEREGELPGTESK